MKMLMVLAALSASMSGDAFAQADLAKAKNCVACHAVNTRLVGPAFRDVATRYAGQKEVEDKLVQKLIKGGAGAWGPIPMPPNPDLGETEARSLVKWVLAQK